MPGRFQVHIHPVGGRAAQRVRESPRAVVERDRGARPAAVVEVLRPGGGDNGPRRGTRARWQRSPRGLRPRRRRASPPRPGGRGGSAPGRRWRPDRQSRPRRQGRRPQGRSLSRYGARRRDFRRSTLPTSITEAPSPRPLARDGTRRRPPRRSETHAQTIPRSRTGTAARYGCAPKRREGMTQTRSTTTASTRTRRVSQPQIRDQRASPSRMLSAAQMASIHATPHPSHHARPARRSEHRIDLSPRYSP